LKRGCRSRQFEYRRLNEFGGGGAVAPAKIWATSIGVTDTTEIRWRGHGGGAALAAGLATGLIIGGLVAAPRYYDGPYPYYGGLYPAGYVGRSAMVHRGWEGHCSSRDRPFDPMSGTYRGRDGRRHYCR